MKGVPAPPFTIAGKYEVESILGRGGMGVVFLARQQPIGRRVAIKMILGWFADDAEYLERFRREATVVGHLSHPGIVPIHDVIEHEGHWCIVMEYVRGRTLADEIEHRGRLDPARVVHIGAQVALALDFCHRRRVVHRDIKPENIMLGEEDTARVMDFGVAKAPDTGVRTRTGLAIGTPRYMSPEQAQGLASVGPAADLYSLGCVLYEMLTGRTPFDGEQSLAIAMAHVNEPPPPLHLILPEVDPDLEAVVLRCLRKRPEERHATGKELADSLRALEGRFGAGGPGAHGRNTEVDRTSLMPADALSSSARRDLAREATNVGGAGGPAAAAGASFAPLVAAPLGPEAPTRPSPPRGDPSEGQAFGAGAVPSATRPRGEGAATPADASGLTPAPFALEAEGDSADGWSRRAPRAAASPSPPPSLAPGTGIGSTGAGAAGGIVSARPRTAAGFGTGARRKTWSELDPHAGAHDPLRFLFWVIVIIAIFVLFIAAALLAGQMMQARRGGEPPPAEGAARVATPAPTPPPTPEPTATPAATPAATPTPPPAPTPAPTPAETPPPVRWSFDAPDGFILEYNGLMTKAAYARAQIEPLKASPEPEATARIEVLAERAARLEFEAAECLSAGRAAFPDSGRIAFFFARHYDEKEWRAPAAYYYRIALEKGDLGEGERTLARDTLLDLEAAAEEEPARPARP